MLGCKLGLAYFGLENRGVAGSWCGGPPSGLDDLIGDLSMRLSIFMPRLARSNFNN
jgi:hypothetical protein